MGQLKSDRISHLWVLTLKRLEYRVVVLLQPERVTVPSTEYHNEIVIY